MMYHDALPEYVQVPYSKDPTEAERQHPAKWSNEVEPPPIGETVRVAINGIGEATVCRYFTSDGWLGLVVNMKNPPRWMIEQNGHRRCHVYGNEIEVRQ